MLYCPPFSTVYNIFLCLHIFSVHITHQNKKRNYENLDQLSYDNKRGPKVYLHGQCTPPTNFPNVATRNQPKPVTSRTQKCPSLGSTCFSLIFYFETFPYDLNEEWFCYEKSIIFRSSKKKKKKKKKKPVNSAPAFIIFIFSFNKGMHVLRTHTLTHKKSLQVSFLCGEPVVWDKTASQMLLPPVL